MALPIVNFVKLLHKPGVPIITPTQMDIDNSQQIDERIWVVYPFINGATTQKKMKKFMRLAGCLAIFIPNYRMITQKS